MGGAGRECGPGGDMLADRFTVCRGCAGLCGACGGRLTCGRSADGAGNMSTKQLLLRRKPAAAVSEKAKAKCVRTEENVPQEFKVKAQM